MGVCANIIFCQRRGSPMAASGAPLVWGQCAFYFKMALFKSRGKVATAPS